MADWHIESRMCKKQDAQFNLEWLETPFTWKIRSQYGYLQ